MKQRVPVYIPKSILDPKQPWKLKRPAGPFQQSPWRMKTKEWHRLLAQAEQGDADSMVRVSDIYESGCQIPSGRTLVHRSSQKSLRWLRRAAEAKGYGAQNNLGVYLSRPKSTSAERSEAHRWFLKAFRSGDHLAAENMALAYREEGKMRNAVAWFRKGDLRIDGGLAIQLGLHRYFGIGTRMDPKSAVSLFRSAIKSKNISGWERDNGYFYLAIPYLEGKGVRISVSKAKKLLERANIDGDHQPAARLRNILQKHPSTR